MFYGNQVQETRRLFFLSWQKYLKKEPMSALEQQIAAVVLEHPEYHYLFEAKEFSVEQFYFPEIGQANPFLHLGLHLAIRDQISTDRPKGILSIYQQLLKKYVDSLCVEHLMMEHLAECLWQAQRQKNPPDDASYLNAVRNCLLAS